MDYELAFWILLSLNVTWLTVKLLGAIPQLQKRKEDEK